MHTITVQLPYQNKWRSWRIEGETKERREETILAPKCHFLAPSTGIPIFWIALLFLKLSCTWLYCQRAQSVVYLPVKFQRKSVHFPWRYSPHNPDTCLIAHYGVQIFSGSFLCYCCRSPLCPALRTASPWVPMHCLAHIFPACSLSPPHSWSVCSPHQSCIKDVLWSS